MPISEAYRRGFKRATAIAAEIAFQRRIVCEDAADKYDKSGQTQFAATERCAAREASYIWEQTLKLKPNGERPES